MPCVFRFRRCELTDISCAGRNRTIYVFYLKPSISERRSSSKLRHSSSAVWLLVAWHAMRGSLRRRTLGSLLKFSQGCVKFDSLITGMQTRSNPWTRSAAKCWSGLDVLFQAAVSLECSDSVQDCLNLIRIFHMYSFRCNIFCNFPWNRLYWPSSTMNGFCCHIPVCRCWFLIWNLLLWFVTWWSMIYCCILSFDIR